MSPGNNSTLPASCCILGALLPADFAWVLHHCECVWCGRMTGVNPLLAALLKPSARCLPLNHVFPWADLYLHLKGMLIGQICKQSPNNSMERIPWGFGNTLLGDTRRHEESSKLQIWALWIPLISNTNPMLWWPSSEAKRGFQNRVWYKAVHAAGGLEFYIISNWWRIWVVWS